MKLGSSIGILGGGQLARMMALRGLEMGFQVHILCPDANEPAALVTKHWHQGDPHKAEDLQAFLPNLDFLTFESEFFDAKYIEQTFQKHTKKHSKACKIAPSSKILGKLQDRLLQKELLVQYKIPTAKFISIHEDKDLHEATPVFPKGFVLKLRTHGYDGNGTWVFHSANEVSGKNKLPDFTMQPCIAEEKIKIKKELAVMFVRSEFGEIVQLPLVESIQKDNRCDLVLGPMKHPQLKSVSKKICRMLEQENYIGAIGFEFFDSAEGLIVNEIAPRVHNTGHYSQLALSEDQFSLHMKAISGQHIQTPKILAKAFAMINLIGQGASHAMGDDNIKGSLHWYGKSESKIGRKMGHVNYIGTNLAALKKQALQERKRFKL